MSLVPIEPGTLEYHSSRIRKLDHDLGRVLKFKKFPPRAKVTLTWRCMGQGSTQEPSEEEKLALIPMTATART